MARFGDWYRAQPRGTSVRLEREYGIGHTTIHRLANGGIIDSYSLAKRIEEATGGRVRVRDVCEAETPRKRGKR